MAIMSYRLHENTIQDGGVDIKVHKRKLIRK